MDQKQSAASCILLITVTERVVKTWSPLRGTVDNLLMADAQQINSPI